MFVLAEYHFSSSRTLVKQHLVHQMTGLVDYPIVLLFRMKLILIVRLIYRLPRGLSFRFGSLWLCILKDFDQRVQF
jgi:hypothetical protein